MVQEWSPVRRLLSTCENTQRQRLCDQSFFKIPNCPWILFSCSFLVFWIGMSLLQTAHYCLLL
ncbi:rCG65872 [Rattus norvegicus]|uniref:RCG65872 n=1 Tax=Rattus norvegicus TaxID=10116 RepID=A6KHF0_RAT|nr:rCG65872 [Rattus norvegicus]